MSRIVTSLLVFTAAASPGFGWGRDGHRIAGQIASHYLTDDARTAINDLLDDQSLADVSTWADEIKSDPSYDWARPLHYANVKPGADSFDLKRDCPEEGCVVRAVLTYAKQLHDPALDRTKRATALKFLVHFVQDLHQPLHVSRARDRGGNDIKVEFFHDRTNLHRVWDSGLLRRTKKPWQEYARELHERITDKQLTAWRQGRPSEWATESYKLALSHAYKFPPDGVLGEEYLERNLPIVEKRLCIAGVRLAYVLNRIMAGKENIWPE